MGPCAKQSVRCVITARDGQTFVGTNDCANPQQTCPRAPGEDYTKCRTVCRQYGHAERDALSAAGDRAIGATAQVVGHTYYCADCQRALFEAGVAALLPPVPA